MAYKEESEQQFIETIVRQARGPMRRPFGDQQFHGNHYSGGHTSEDDNFLDFDDPQEDDNYEKIEPEYVDSVRGNRSSLSKPQIGSEIDEPMPQFGGYSSDTGSRHMPAPEARMNTGMSNQILQLQMRKLKKAIENKERELHELQQEKVKLMRKITGRLE